MCGGCRVRGRPHQVRLRRRPRLRRAAGGLRRPDGAAHALPARGAGALDDRGSTGAASAKQADDRRRPDQSRLRPGRARPWPLRRDDPHDPAGAHADARSRMMARARPQLEVATGLRRRRRAARGRPLPRVRGPSRCVRGCPVGIDIPAFIRRSRRRLTTVPTTPSPTPTCCPPVCGRGVPAGEPVRGRLHGRRLRWSRWRSGGSSASSATLAIRQRLGQRAAHRADLPGRHRRRRSGRHGLRRPTWPRRAARSRCTRPSPAGRRAQVRASPTSGCRTR